MFNVLLAALLTLASTNATARPREASAAPEGTGVVLVEWIRSLTRSNQPIAGDFTFACSDMDARSAFMVTVYSKTKQIDVYQRLARDGRSCRRVMDLEKLAQQHPQIFIELQSALQTLDDSQLPADRRWRLTLLMQTDLTEYFARQSWAQKISNFFGMTEVAPNNEFQVSRKLEFLD